MSWYIHPSKQLRDDDLPPELVVTNRDGSIEQVYVPYDASDKLEAENAELRSLVGGLMSCPVHRDDCVKWKCKHLKVVSKGENGDRPRYVCMLCKRANEMGIEEKWESRSTDE